MRASTFFKILREAGVNYHQSTDVVPVARDETVIKVLAGQKRDDPVLWIEIVGTVKQFNEVLDTLDRKRVRYLAARGRRANTLWIMICNGGGDEQS